MHWKGMFSEKKMRITSILLKVFKISLVENTLEILGNVLYPWEELSPYVGNLLSRYWF